MPTEGFVNVEGGKIWYKIYGAEKKGTPLLLVHGGPGSSSMYLQPLEKIAQERPVIFYDQLGAGRSEQPNDTSLWKMSRFVDELTALRKELGLTKIHLFAHSMGGGLATQYMEGNPEGVVSLTLSSPVISVAKFLEDNRQLKRLLRDEVRDTLLFYENTTLPKSAGFQQAYADFLKTYYCRIEPHPKEMQESEKHSGIQVLMTMWGPDEFECIGNLRDFDKTAVLKTIRIPVLFTCGRYDFCTPATTKWFSQQVENSDFKVFEESSHMALNEQPSSYIAAISKFLNSKE